jgi:hypothetical protein
MEDAWADSEKGGWSNRDLLSFWNELERMEAILSHFRLPQTHSGHQEKLLPRVLTHRVTEERLISALSKPEGATLLLLTPSEGKISLRTYLPVYQGLIIDLGPENLISCLDEPLQQFRKISSL